ncbi:MAG: type II toxin-antitoxin system VapC family toxin [Actinomycetes bacterium]
MIAYFDTAAVVPLRVEERGTAVCRRVWEAADSLVATRLLHVEAAAALARAATLGRLSANAHETALLGLDTMWQQFDVIELTEDLMLRAAGMAQTYGLRGFDAVHCAAASILAGPSTVAVTGDRALLTAWQSNGLQVVDIHA